MTRVRAARARSAVAVMFFVNGGAIASWLPHIPAVKARHAIGDGELGAVLLAMAAGAVLALPVAGWLVGRFGSRRMTALSASALCCVLPAPVLSPSVPVLVLSLVVLGAWNAILDVSMNANGVLVEQAYGRPIMSSFHGLYSLGGLVGAALAGAAMWVGAGDGGHVLLSALVSLVAVGSAAPWLLPSPPDSEGAGPVFARPTGVLLRLGVLAFAALLAEGAMADWSAVYLRDALGSSPALAAGGFAAFSLTMALGRLGGDRLVARLGPRALVRASGTTAALGLAAALLVGRPLAAIVGCGLVGIGIANVIPVVFSRAGKVRGVRPGTGLAAVATTGYLGLLAGPPLIGLAAEVTSLPLALGVVSAFCALVALGAPVVAPSAARSRGGQHVDEGHDDGGSDQQGRRVLE